MSKFNALDNGGKIRITVFLILMLMQTLSVYIGALFQADMVDFVAECTERSANEGKIFIDGADVSWVNNVNIVGAVVLGIIVALVITFIIALGCLLSLGIFRALAFRGVSEAQEEEYLLAARVRSGISVFAAAISVSEIAKHSVFWILSGAVLCVPMYLFSYLFCIMPLKKLSGDAERSDGA